MSVLTLKYQFKLIPFSIVESDNCKDNSSPISIMGRGHLATIALLALQFSGAIAQDVCFLSRSHLAAS